MRPLTRSFFILPLLLPFTSCGGGGGDAGAGFGAACRGAADLCLVQCSLGCSLEGCSVKSIPINQRILFRFSQPIDPASVNPSTMRLRSSQGQQPIGELLVQGTDVVFKPAVLGANRYGLEENETYTLEIPGGPNAAAAITSRSGDSLDQSIRCELVTDRGVVDADGKEPIGTVVVPDPKITRVKADTLIVVEFSESINTLPFQNGGTGGTILYKVALPDSTTPNGCARRFFSLPGTASLSEDIVTGQTSVIFRPSLLLPSEACVEVEITDQIRDLSGKAAKSQLFNFIVEARPVQDQFILETFDSDGKQDNTRSGATWGNGVLTTGRLGGSGILGSFVAADGKDVGKLNNRDVFEWNLDSSVIPASRTLTNKEITVTNGIFEFTDFIVAPSEHVRFIGTKPPVIRVTGRVQIDGVVSLETPAPPRNLNANTGWAGGAGGPGGARGGQGADKPSVTNGSINGRNGENVVVPAGHPRAAQAAGTGGPGSKAFPTTAKASDIVWITVSGFKVFVRQMASGGSGGSLYDIGDNSLLGGVGRLVEKRSPQYPILGPYQATEFPPTSTRGKAFPVLPTVSSISSRDLFLIGGSGGGGGGTHAAFSPAPSLVSWSPGYGGAGGGGIMSFESGGDFVVGTTGEIYARGGSALASVNSTTSPPAFAPGGGGSGGSILIQTAGTPTISGKVDVLGGKGGTFREALPLVETEGFAGDGGAGYIRVEADPAPSAAAFGGFAPKASANNVGLLRSIENRDVTVAASSIYVARSLFPPTWLYYVIEAKIEGRSVVYSDDPRRVPGSRIASSDQPIAFYAKSVAADAQTSKPIGDPTPWVAETVKSFGQKRFEGQAGNGVQYLLVLDKSKTPSKSGSVVVERIRIFYRG